MYVHLYGMYIYGIYVYVCIYIVIRKRIASELRKESIGFDYINHEINILQNNN